MVDEGGKVEARHLHLMHVLPIRHQVHLVYVRHQDLIVRCHECQDAVFLDLCPRDSLVTIGVPLIRIHHGALPREVGKIQVIFYEAHRADTVGHVAPMVGLLEQPVLLDKLVVGHNVYRLGRHFPVKEEVVNSLPLLLSLVHLLSRIFVE